ncbi:MAG: alpha-amylase family glycosyl hydrolase [Candidatus Lernaella stagnicola]|nr:alpha-amylase family glycosyl hydrolase [Candidatus Lernaella stagnicola]
MVQLKHLLIVAALLGALLLPSCGEKHETKDFDAPPAAEAGQRVVIYQLVPRLFSNINENREWDGDLAANGVGKFEHIDEVALTAIKELGATHIWLTGVLQQATNTDYSHLDPPQPADDPDVLKGKAGSFYAIKDYFDICPDYALDPQNRVAEFEALVQRIHDAEMKVIIDFVPNHVARTYDSDVRPDLNFGDGDDTSLFFHPQNNFFYLVEPEGQVLSIPEPSHWPRPAGADGTVETENNDGNPPGDVPKATGNNVTSPDVSEFDWYETVKLNYGYDFTTGEAVYEPVPDTWAIMNEVLAYWQGKGVDGFRCDFAHYVPLDAWQYLVSAARERDAEVFFFAEAYYTGDGVPEFSFENMLKVGFDAVYDDSSYDAVKGIFCCGKWANDLEESLNQQTDFLKRNALHYVENHDERRIASPVVAGESPDDSGFGSYQAGMPVAATLFLMGTGPVLIYNGQEVGEEAAEAEGFGGEDGRTSIFDYGSMPRMVQWVNGYQYDGEGLEEGRRALRKFYADLIALSQQPGFSTGDFYSFNYLNKDNWRYSHGQYVYSFARYDAASGDAWLVVANFSNISHAFDLRLAKDAIAFMGMDPESGTLLFYDAFEPDKAPAHLPAKNVENQGLSVTLTPYEIEVYRIQWEKE